ncbi:MAG: hypothetical protein DRI79_05265 [Chloroflexi bacterium]|nr:MAG: hypothetical protein DRI80_13125 [Chloroflexota bacterium]RLC90291.1 MAG: hypothetical protein DRI79_05265 [Chloroflexota bacterium]
MPYTVMIHLLNEDAIVAETERIPEPTDQVLVVTNVRRRDGRDVSYILPESSKVIFPWTRIHCVEILPSEEEEKIVSFIRE